MTEANGRRRARAALGIALRAGAKGETASMAASMMRGARRMALAAGVAALGIVAHALPALAETRAVLVGVSDYEEGSGAADLKGPRNDVMLLERVLRGRGVLDIAMLADGVEGAARPTRSAILGALESMAARAVDGDLVMIHLSGHGTRQFDADGDETDGLDEVFLPADTQKAPSGAREIPNAIRDDEIGEAVDRIRATGADVWLVIDSCHSGTGLRAAGTRTAARQVDPAALGLSLPTAPRETGASIEAAPNPAAAPDPSSPLGPEAGGIVAFYAAQSHELAREVDFAEEGAEPAWFGLFTAKLAARLEAGAPLSYRQLFEAVTQDIATAELPAGARLQTPLWEGTMGEAAALGGAETAGQRAYGLDGDRLSAGAVHGLTEGTLVELLPDIASSEPIGLAQVDAVDALAAFVVPVADDCAPDPAALCPATGAIPAEARAARVVAVPLDLTLDLSETLRPAGSAGDPTLAAALDAAIAAHNDGGGVQFARGSNDDIEVAEVDGALWLGTRALIDGRPAGVSWRPEEGPDALEALLDRIARAERVVRTIGGAASTGLLAGAPPVATLGQAEASDPALLAAAGQSVDPVRECRRVARSGAYTVVGDLSVARELKQCDRLTVAAQGRRPGTFDVNRVVVDSQFCVSSAWARVEGARAPVPLGDPMFLCSDCPGGYAAGAERMFVLVSEAPENAPPLNLTGLLDTCGRGAATRGAAAGARVEPDLTGVERGARALLGLVAEVEPPATRGSMSAAMPKRVWVEESRWTVLPRGVALQN